MKLQPHTLERTQTNAVPRLRMKSAVKPVYCHVSVRLFKLYDVKRIVEVNSILISQVKILTGRKNNILRHYTERVWWTWFFLFWSIGMELTSPQRPIIRESGNFKEKLKSHLFKIAYDTSSNTCWHRNGV